MAEIVQSISDNQMICLISQECHSFEIRIKDALLSKLVKTMIDYECEDSEVQEIPLPNVPAPTLAKVIEFMQHYSIDPVREVEKPLKTVNMEELIQEWYFRFISVEPETLCEIVLAANYMDIKPLLDLTCATLASIVKGKTPDEIHSIFDIKSDLTPEDIEKVKSDIVWVDSDDDDLH